MKTTTFLAITATLVIGAGDAIAQLPMSGRPVTHAADGTPITSFTEIDTKIQTLMQTYGIEAGVVGINRGGRTIYLHSFGWLEKPAGIPLPETAMLRVASVTKVITAAAIHAMDEEKLLGAAGINRKVFNLPGNGGMLFVVPSGGLGDPDFADITISHMLGHAGGFRRGDDPYNTIRQVATDLDVPSPPTMYDIMRWRLGRPLADTPGAQSIMNPVVGGVTIDPYSNFGFNVLGQIVELAPGGYDNFVRSRVLSAANWIPSSDWAHGRTFLADRHPREPRYQSTLDKQTANNIYDNNPVYQQVPPPYGEFSIETGFWAGGMIISAQAMLTFGSIYQTGYTEPASGAIDNIGSRIDADNPPLSGGHTGGFAGTCSFLNRDTRGTDARDDDIVTFIAFTRSRDIPAGSNLQGFETLALADVNSVIDTIPPNRWPDAECDGFWVKPAARGNTGRGGYNDEYTSFAHAHATVTDGSKLQLKAGSSPWTGTITKRLALRAPEGAFTIGRP